jgi:hypothetical protein
VFRTLLEAVLLDLVGRTIAFAKDNVWIDFDGLCVLTLQKYLPTLEVTTVNAVGQMGDSNQNDTV